MKRLILVFALLASSGLLAQEELEEGGKKISGLDATSLVWDVHDDAGNAAKNAALPPGTPLLEDWLGRIQQAPPPGCSVEPVAGQVFDRCLRVSIPADAPKDGGPIVLKAFNDQTVANKDMGLVTFWARTVAAGRAPAKVQVVVQMAKGAQLGSYLRDFRLNEKWQKFYCPFRFKIKTGSEPAVLPPGGEELRVAAPGNPGQIIEIADVQWTRHAADAGFACFPITTLSYAGREADAPWRAGAEARIEAFRKADFAIDVRDSSGRPVPGAEIEVRMVRAAFPFGTAVRGKILLEDPSPNRDRYRSELKRNFTRTVFEGETKWISWSDPASRTLTLRAADWIQQNGLDLRGHVLVYPKWRKNQPALQKQYGNDPEGLRKAIEAFISDMAGALKGRITDWDVINEYTAPEDWVGMLGKPVMVEWFRKAREVDPGAALVFNDNSIAITADGAVHSPRQELYYETIRYLVENGAPIDGMGLQYRAFSHRLSPPASVLAVFDILNGLGPDIYITEFDLLVEDEQLQADLMRDYLTIAFSQPKVKAFLLWGFWDGAHHRNNAPLFREDWSLKPSGEVYRDLVFNKWWTHAEGTSDKDGRFSGRGFLGRYDITVRVNGRSLARQADLARDGLNMKIEWDGGQNLQ